MNIRDMLNKNIAYIVPFLIVSIVKLLYSIFYVHESSSIIAIRCISLCIYLLLSYYAYKKHTLAAIIIAILILLTGFSSLVVGIVMSTHSLILKIASCIIGVYFVYGGIKIFSLVKEERKKMREGLSGEKKVSVLQR